MVGTFVLQPSTLTWIKSLFDLFHVYYLFFCFILFILLVLIYLDSKQFLYIKDVTKDAYRLSLYCFFTVLFITFFKILIKILYINILQTPLDVFQQDSFSIFEINQLNGGLLSDSILFLAVGTGLICLFLLNDKDLNKSILNFFYFNIFIFATTILVYTNNLMILFISFELLFVPTIYYVWNIFFSKKVDSATLYLFNWTFLGAIIFLGSVSYVYSITNSTNLYTIYHWSFSNKEKFIIFFSAFLGLGIKMPLFPFYFWLTRVHVEASAGFSVFLSGFLVKTAVYCFYVFLYILKDNLYNELCIVLIFLGILDSSMKMWVQVDLKKLIAYATVQEMNLILIFLLLKDNLFNTTLIAFLVMHAILSTLLFFSVDNIQKSFKTRNITQLGGLFSLNFKFSIFWVFNWLIFIGFPLTVKFLIELQIVFLTLMSFGFFGVFIIIFSIILGSIGFSRQLFLILFGVPTQTSCPIVLSLKDKYIYIFCYCILIILYLFFFLI